MLQITELLDHARKMEQDRAELIAEVRACMTVLRAQNERIENVDGEPSAYLTEKCDHARALLARIEKEK